MKRCSRYCWERDVDFDVWILKGFDGQGNMLEEYHIPAEALDAFAPMFSKYGRASCPHLHSKSMYAEVGYEHSRDTNFCVGEW